MKTGWDRMARWRDARSGERGDLWHRELIDPTVRAAVGPVAGLRILDLACGNGYLGRSFAREGALEVVGLDASRPMIRFARARERARPTGARFVWARAGRLPFPSARFDLVVANMALMDIEDAQGAVREVARVLVRRGRFVFSLSHPCFDLDDRSTWDVERGYGTDGVYRDIVWRRVRGYRDEAPCRVPWRPGPRTTVWTESYPRTLSTYSELLRRAGFVIRRLDEPAPTRAMIRQSPQGAYLAEIPLHLVVEAIRDGVRRGSRTSEGNRRAVGPRSVSGGRRRRSGSARRGSSPGS